MSTDVRVSTNTECTHVDIVLMSTDVQCIYQYRVHTCRHSAHVYRRTCIYQYRVHTCRHAGYTPKHTLYTSMDIVFISTYSVLCMDIITDTVYTYIDSFHTQIFSVHIYSVHIYRHTVYTYSTHIHRCALYSVYIDIQSTYLYCRHTNVHIYRHTIYTFITVYCIRIDIQYTHPSIDILDVRSLAFANRSRLSETE